jgi:hypothetical protein
MNILGAQTTHKTQMLRAKKARPIALTGFCNICRLV